MKLAYIGIGLSVVGLMVFLYIRNNSSTVMAKKIKELGGTAGDVSSFDKPFLKAWLNALEKGSEKFTYAGNTHASVGGRRVA